MQEKSITFKTARLAKDKGFKSRSKNYVYRGGTTWLTNCKKEINKLYE